MWRYVNFVDTLGDCIKIKESLGFTYSSDRTGSSSYLKIASKNEHKGKSQIINSLAIKSAAWQGRDNYGFLIELIHENPLKPEEGFELFIYIHHRKIML